MESDDEEDINDEALKGSFLALKQLQIKGRKVAQIKKVSSEIRKLPTPAIPRSTLYEEFKKCNSLDPSSTTIDLETKLPISLSMYRTYDKIFSEKYKKIRYTEQNKPYHPFFGVKAVLADEFKASKIPDVSIIDKSIIEGTQDAIYLVDYNFFSLGDAAGESQQHSTKIEKPVVIKPLKRKKNSTQIIMKMGGLDPKLLANIQKIVVSSDDEN